MSKAIRQLPSEGSRVERAPGSGVLDRIPIGQDYFDASINRVAAWTIGGQILTSQVDNGEGSCVQVVQRGII